MAILDLQVAPRKAGEVSVSYAVVAVHKLIEREGFQHVLHPMGTCIEGEPEQLYSLLLKIHNLLIDMKFDRIGMSIRVDHRLDKKQTMLDKIQRVEEQLK